MFCRRWISRELTERKILKDLAYHTKKFGLYPVGSLLKGVSLNCWETNLYELWRLWCRSAKEEKLGVFEISQIQGKVKVHDYS
jgi:hypothetical protein